MAGGSPGLIPKAALTTSRLVYKPFLIPMKLNVSATNVGAAAHGVVGAVNGSIGKAYIDMQPKGPAKWLVPLFVKTQEAVGKSSEKAARNKQVFWDPVSVGSESIGRAIAGPGAYYYAKKAGIPEPGSQQVIQGLLNMPLFSYPGGGGGGQAAPPADGGGEPAAAEPPPPQEGANAAAEGAAQAQPAEAA